MKYSGVVLAIFFSGAALTGCGSSSDEGDSVLAARIASAPTYFGPNDEFTPELDAVVEVTGGRSTYASRLAPELVYQFGTTYELRVTQDYAPASGGSPSSNYITNVVEVVATEQDAVGTTYVYENIELIGSPFTIDDNAIYYFYQYAFECAETVDCDALVDMGDSGGLVDVEFEYTGGETPITLVGWN